MAELASVVIPAYNNEDYIAQTLESVLAQTYPELEVIVADHASSDRTREIVAGFDDARLVLLDTPAGGGAAANWNRVTDAANGTYVKLVCGDDLLYPEAVAAQVAALEAAPTAVLAASQRDLVDARGDVFLRSRGLGALTGVVSGGDAVRATVRAGTNIFGEPACVTIRRNALARAGGWDATKQYYIDAGSYARVLAGGDFVAVRQPLAAFRVSATQWSVRLMQEQQAQAEEFHAEMGELFPDAVTPADIRRGNRMARVASWQRRAAYAALGKRMRPRD